MVFFWLGFKIALSNIVPCDCFKKNCLEICFSPTNRVFAEHIKMAAPWDHPDLPEPFSLGFFIYLKKKRLLLNI